MRQLSFRLMDTARTCSMYLRILSVPTAAHGVFVSRGAWSAGRDTLAAAAACLAGQGNSLSSLRMSFQIYQLFSILSCSAFISSGVEVYCEMARLRGSWSCKSHHSSFVF